MDIQIFRWRTASGFVLMCLLSVLLSGCGGGGGSGSGSAPAAPANVGIAITAPGEVTLSWDAVVGASSYSVYVASSSGVSKSGSPLTSSITSTQYVHSGLTAGNTYYYVVTASNGHGESSESSEVQMLVQAASAPVSISAVAADGAVTLLWDIAPATTYNVYLASQSGVTSANHATLTDGAAYSGVSSPYTITGLANGTTYYLVVTGNNGYGESGESGELPVTPSAISGTTVSGVVRYEDKQYSVTTGFTGNTTYRAVRFAEVEAVDAAGGAVVGSATTDATGVYSISLPANQAGKTLYVRVIASAVTPAVAVYDMSNILFAVPGKEFALTGDVTADISIPVSNEAAGAFNILDVLSSGAEFVQSLSGSYPSQSNAYWQQGNTMGTYYCIQVPDPGCPHGVGIYILNDGNDTDEFDDDVLLHEYGHFVAAQFSKDDSPGGMHYVSSNDLDMRLTWSEGWGDFFPGAVKTWLPLSRLSALPALTKTYYIDTVVGGANSFDFGNPIGAEYYYSSNEAAVAKVLHDVRINHGAQAIWDVISSTQFTLDTTPANLELFHDSWNSLGKPDITATLAARSINYSLDNREPGDGAFDNLRLLTVGQSESHTLYGSGDVDYIAFNAIAGLQYTVSTTQLRNGADTVIRVFAPDKTTVVASNDNTNNLSYAGTVPNIYDWSTGEYHENGGDILGSTASFIATATGVFHVEVRSSAQRPLSAGRYGNYLLSITSP